MKGSFLLFFGDSPAASEDRQKGGKFPVRSLYSRNCPNRFLNRSSRMYLYEAQIIEILSYLKAEKNVQSKN